MLKISLGIILLILLTGCSNKQYPVTFDSDPQGGMLVCNGVKKGLTPQTLYYTLDERNEQTKTLNIVPCGIIWRSGLKKAYDSSFDLNEFPNGVMQTLHRPNGDGYDRDVDFELEAKRLKLEERRTLAAERTAKAAEDAADEAYYENLQNMNKNQLIQQQNYQIQNMNTLIRNRLRE